MTQTVKIPPAKTSNHSPSLRSWGVTAAVIAAGGLALQLAGPALNARFESWPDLAEMTRQEEPPPVENTTPVESAPEETPEEPSGPQLTYEEIETMLAPLADRVLQLIEDGRKELPDYKDMKSERGRRFFQNWGNTWNNRLNALAKDTPPPEECNIHAPLEPTCAMLYQVTAILRTVPKVANVKEGKEILDQAWQGVEDFLNPPEVENDGVDTEEDPGAEDPGAED